MAPVRAVVALVTEQLEEQLEQQLKEQLEEQLEELATTAPPLAALPGELGGEEPMAWSTVVLLVFGCLALAACLAQALTCLYTCLARELARAREEPGRGARASSLEGVVMGATTIIGTTAIKPMMSPKVRI